MFRTSIVRSARAVAQASARSYSTPASRRAIPTPFAAAWTPAPVSRITAVRCYAAGAIMASPASSDPRASTDRVNKPTLLGIPAELRNIIYDNVFSSETKHGLVLHALTRVSQCIRRESLAMYYASTRSNTLEILLHNPTQFAHAKQWLAEVDTNLYQCSLTLNFRGPSTEPLVAVKREPCFVLAK
jgi:hypothetical protein